MSHLPAFRALEVVPSVLVDPDLLRAQELAREFGVARAVASVAELPSDIEAAVVAVPAAVHPQVSIALVERGAHVLVEKPLAANVADGEAMIQAASRAGVTLSIGLMRRFFESAQWVKGCLAAGHLGAVTGFCCEEGAPYRWPIATDSGFRHESAGGGVLLDTGSHTLDLLQWWLGALRVVEYRDDSYGGVEADCRVVLELENGVRGTVELSRTRMLSNRARIEGERGSIEVAMGDNEISAEPSSLTRHRYRGHRADRLRTQTVAELFTAQLAAWLETVNRRGSASVPAEEGLQTLRTIEACYQGRRPLDLPWLQPAGQNGTAPC